MNFITGLFLDLNVLLGIISNSRAEVFNVMLKKQNYGLKRRNLSRFELEGNVYFNKT